MSAKLLVIFLTHYLTDFVFAILLSLHVVLFPPAYLRGIGAEGLNLAA